MSLHGPPSTTPFTLTTRDALAARAHRPGLLFLVECMQIPPRFPPPPPPVWRRSTELLPQGHLPLHWEASQWPWKVSPNPTFQAGGPCLALSPWVSGVCPLPPMFLEAKGLLGGPCGWGLPSHVSLAVNPGTLYHFLPPSLPPSLPSISGPGPHGHSYT